MPIVPLPVFEADADPRHRNAMSDEEIYARLETPKTLVVRFGHLKYVAEYPYDGSVKPGCGSKLVARTHRGTEVVEMLTTTCSNSGCGKSVSRREMLDYIDHSGGKDYPFHSKGRVLRVATIDDLNAQSALDAGRREAVKSARAIVAELNLAMKIVEAEPILGGECLTFYYMSEQRIDFRELVQRLAAQFTARIEMRQVGARDEARIVADYERCGQHCCCKNFLKVLKPVSMRQAKVQKATLDPLKISGRCGRLMCCLRYEDQTYKELKSKLPHRNTRVGTAEGPGVVVDSKILVQLVLVRLEHDMREIAVPVEELMDPNACPKPKSAMELAAAQASSAEPSPPLAPPRRDRERERSGDRNRNQDQRGQSRRDRPAAEGDRKPPRPDRQQPRGDQSSAPAARPAELRSEPPSDGSFASGPQDAAQADAAGGRRKRRRRRRRGRQGGDGDGAASGESQQHQQRSDADRHRQQDAFRQRSQQEEQDNSAVDNADSDDSADAGEHHAGDEAAAPGSAGREGGGRRRRRRRRRRHGGGGKPGPAA